MGLDDQLAAFHGREGYLKNKASEEQGEGAEIFEARNIMIAHAYHTTKNREIECSMAQKIVELTIENE